MADPIFESPPPPSPAPESEVVTGRGARKKRLTWKLLQQLPAAPTPISEPSTLLENTEPALLQSPDHITIETTVKTACNSFGLYREYPNIPTHNPDDTMGLVSLADSSPPTTVNETELPVTAPLSIPTVNPSSDVTSYFPFANSTIFGLMNWMWTGSIMKSMAEMNKLVAFLKSDNFQKDDLDAFNIKGETAKFDRYLGRSDTTDTRVPRDGWRESTIKIQVPDGEAHSRDEIPTFDIPGLHHRSIIEVIKAAFSDPNASSFHYTPFKSFWKNPSKADAEPTRVYDELYSSDAMIDAHEKLQRQPPEPGCNLERVVASLMLWSDSTHLANFGTASLWPIYLFFGNQSKWVRGKPKTASCHHIAYIPKVCFQLSLAAMKLIMSSNVV